MNKRLSRSIATIWVCMLVGCLGRISAVWAIDSELQTKIETELRLLHPKENPDWWRALGPSAPRVIMGMVGDSENIRHRHRLISVLGYFRDDPQVVEFLKKQAEKSEDDVLQAASIEAVGKAGGAKEARFVSQFLSSADAQVRFAAAKALQEMRDPQAQAFLDPFLAREKNSWMAAKLKGELPKPIARLKPSGSTEDRPAPGLPGSWRGFRVMPDPRGGGMKSEACVLRLVTPRGAGAGLDAELLLTPAPGLAPRAEAVSGVRGEGMRLSGRIRLPGETDPAEFTGQARSEAGVQVLEIRVPKNGAVYLLRKE